MTNESLERVAAAMSKPMAHEEFLELLDQHRRILFKIANLYVRSPADREDLVQEMILQLWRSIGRYDERRPFSTWMYRVALNVAISYCRNESRRPRTGALGDALQVAAAPEAPGPQADLLLLQELIARLDELDRALVMLYLDGNHYETIAEILGISETNVGTKLGRIRDKLRRMGADHCKKEGLSWNSMN
jgi:RNA polymerase sigma factor (sigma-70 family)